MIARLGDQRGITLIEVLLGLTLTLAVVGMSLDLLATGQADHQRTAARSETVAEVHTNVARLMRELHQATDFDYVSPKIVEAEIWAGPGTSSRTALRVRYDCSLERVCRRYAAPVGQALPAEGVVMVTGVANADAEGVFTPSPDTANPTYVKVDVKLGVDGAQQPIVISDGTSLPNLALD